MRKAGYAKGSIDNPSSNFTQTKGFKELIESVGVSDEDLAEILAGGLRANKIITSPTEPDREYPDWPSRHKFLETGLKLKGYTKDQTPTNVYQIIKEQKNNYGL